MNDLLKIDENKPVKQSNRLIEAKYKLTKYEQRLILAICSQLEQNAENFETVRVSVAEMAKFCHFEEKKSYTLVKNTIMRLLTRTLQIKHQDGSWYATHWLQSARYIPDESIIEYRVDDTLKPELLQLKAAYLSTPTAPLMTFNSDYSTRFYFLLKKMLKIGEIEYELDFIRERFQLSKAYKIFFNLKNKVLEPALQEINEKSDIKVEHEYIKEGRSYKRIHFVVTAKEKAKPAKLAAPSHDYGLNEEQQAYLVHLKDRGINPTKQVIKIIKEVPLDELREEERGVLGSKDTAQNLAGLIISAFQNRYAQTAKENKRQAERVEEAKRQERRQAYDDFHGTSMTNIGKAEEAPEKESPKKELTELTDWEVDMIKQKGEEAGGIIIKRMKKLGLTVEDVRAGKRK